MKKLFFVIFTAISSMVSNIEPVVNTPVSYTDNSYYTGRVHSDTDYKTLYDQYASKVSDSGDSCDLTPIQGETDAMLEGETGACYFVEGAEKIKVSKHAQATKLGCNNGDRLLAPWKCEIVTSANSSQLGHTMTIRSVSGTYQVTFYNMERWYCCIGRKLPKGARGFTHTQDAKGTILSKGCVLGVATKKTKVLIEVNKGGTYSPISLYDFYYY